MRKVAWATMASPGSAAYSCKANPPGRNRLLTGSSQALNLRPASIATHALSTRDIARSDVLRAFGRAATPVPPDLAGHPAQRGHRGGLRDPVRAHSPGPDGRPDHDGPQHRAIRLGFLGRNADPAR